MNITKEEFIKKFIDSNKKAGWFDLKPDNKYWKGFAEDLLTIANDLPIGVVLEKRGDKIQCRFDNEYRGVIIKYI